MDWILVLGGMLMFLEDEADKALKHFRKLGGIWPLPGRYKITSGFGYRKHPVTGEWKFHSGVDLAVPCYTPVYAPFNGTVRYYYSSSGGNNLIITSFDGVLAFGFSHLYQVLKRSGSVLKGERVALTGGRKGMPGAGLSTGCHLHFTLRYKGKLIDPAPFIRRLGVVV